MATIKAFIRTRRNGETKIRFRLSDGSGRQYFFTSHLMVLPSLWDARRETVKTRCICKDSYRRRIDDGVRAIKDKLMRVYEQSYAQITDSESFQRLVEMADAGSESENPTLDSEYRNLVEMKHLSPSTVRAYGVLLGYIKRSVGDIPLSLMVEADVQKVIDAFSEGHSPNYIHTMFSRLRSLFNSLVQTGAMAQSPMLGKSVAQEHYGTPYYLTLAERNKIAGTDLSERPKLEAQRDIFIFQCCVGCRVSDLLRFTADNIVDGALEYVPTKTKTDATDIVRVPLNNTALSLVRKWQGVDRQGRLFPFVSAQRYNDDIKSVFSLCGVTRSVLVYDSTRGKEVRRPLNEIATSHLARRTFIGNLYRQVKDPSLVGSMSGHKDGSKAFARYRSIDDDIKRELVDLLD